MLWQTPRDWRRQLIENEPGKLSLRQRCELLKVNRSTLYYEAKSTEIDEVSLLNEIREVSEKRPYYGYRRITKELRANGLLVNRKRVQRLMVIGGVRAIYPGPNQQAK